MSKLIFYFLCSILAFDHANLGGAQPTDFLCSSAHNGLNIQQVMQAAIDDARAKDMWVGTLDCDDLSPEFSLVKGPLPTDVEIYNSLINTTRINLESDSITGSISTELGLLTNLNALAITSSQLTSTLPKELLVGLQNISGLVVIGPIRGTVPSEIVQMSSLEIIGLINTLLHGRVLDLLSRLHPLKQIAIYNASFSGTIPSDLPTSEIIGFEINRNRFSGTIPSNLFTSKMEIWDCSSNRFSGTVPTEISKIDNDNFVCEFSRNRFTGTMPVHSCYSTTRAGFIFPTQSPTNSPSTGPTGPTTLSPSDSPVQTKMPTLTEKVAFALISEDEFIFIMIAIGGILLALIASYVAINENYKSITKIALIPATQLEDDPRRLDIMLARELST